VQNQCGDLAREEESRTRVDTKPNGLPIANRSQIISRGKKSGSISTTWPPPGCGRTLQVIGKSVSEMLEWLPAQLRVARTNRPNRIDPLCAPRREALGVTCSLLASAF